MADKIAVVHPEASIPLPEFDLAFIDGDHSKEAVESDIAKCLEVLKPDGLIAFHDYRLKPNEGGDGWDEGVTAAVNELIENGGEIVARHKTLAVVRPPILVSN